MLVPILLPLALAFSAPVEELDRGVPVVLARTPALQWRLCARPAWRRFQEIWGDGWAVRWDERTGAPRFLHGTGAPVSQEGDLVADVAALAGVAGADLVGPQVGWHGDRRVARWSRTWRGAPVVGDQVSVVSRGGRIQGVWVSLTPIDLAEAPLPGEVVLPLPLRKARGDVDDGYRVHLVRRSLEGPWTVSRDRTGREVERRDRRIHDALFVRYEERTAGGTLLEAPARGLTVTDAAGATAVTDEEGGHPLAGELQIQFQGPAFSLTRDDEPVALNAASDATLTPPDDLPWSVADLLASFWQAWDWIGSLRPDLPLLTGPMAIDVDSTDYTCNAYYMSGTLSFAAEGGGCNAFARVSDIVFHELGHGVHDTILASGTFATDVSEGSADFLACNLVGDPYVGLGARPGGSWTREIATDRVWPDDCTGEPHNDGLVWASFLWDLRERWIGSMGEAAGQAAVEELFLDTLVQGPTLTDLAEAVIVADDEDGDLSNGTPHDCELLELLDAHGLGPGPIGVVRFDHVPVESASSGEADYPLVFRIDALNAACTALDEGSLQVWYTTDDTLPVPGSPVADDTGAEEAGYDGWISLPLTGSDGSYEATLPRQPATTHVRYFARAASADGTEVVTTTGGDPTAVWGFWVGDREDLWCEDFESGAPGFVHGAGQDGHPSAQGTDEWSVGRPSGGPDHPSSAWSGANVAGTALSGRYLARNASYLETPLLDLSDGGTMLLLSYRRWLTVEASAADQAWLSVNGQEVWRNDPLVAHLDWDWTLQEVDLAPLLPEAGTFQAAWTLSTDLGTEYGGWSMDDVCVQRLADVPGHYRVRDLEADERQDPVTLAWTVPWMRPMARAMLVRNSAGWPTSPVDGTVVDVQDLPQPGETRTVQDSPGPAPAWYAVFVSPDGVQWYGDVVEGENGVRTGVPDQPGETGDTADSSPPADTGQAPAREPQGCGACDAGGSPMVGWLSWWVAIGLAARRRGRGRERRARA